MLLGDTRLRNELLTLVEEETEVPRKFLLDTSRKVRSTVLLRHLIWTVLSKSGYSTNQIGHLFNCDHSTVSVALQRWPKRFAELCAQDRERVEAIRTRAMRLAGLDPADCSENYGQESNPT